MSTYVMHNTNWEAPFADMVGNHLSQHHSRSWCGRGLPPSVLQTPLPQVRACYHIWLHGYSIRLQEGIHDMSVAIHLYSPGPPAQGVFDATVCTLFFLLKLANFIACKLANFNHQSAVHYHFVQIMFT